MFAVGCATRAPRSPAPDPTQARGHLPVGAQDGLAYDAARGDDVHKWRHLTLAGAHRPFLPFSHRHRKELVMDWAFERTEAGKFNALGDFLRTRRDGVSPEEVGLASG